MRYLPFLLVCVFFSLNKLAVKLTLSSIYSLVGDTGVEGTSSGIQPTSDAETGPSNGDGSLLPGPGAAAGELGSSEDTLEAVSLMFRGQVFRSEFIDLKSASLA